MTVSGEIFKNINFEVINNNNKNVNFELYITKEECNHEIKGEYIKLYLSKLNGDLINGFNSDNVPTYDNLNAIDDWPCSRILYRVTIKRKSIGKFDFKTWISDSYDNFDSKEEFIYKISVRVI